MASTKKEFEKNSKKYLTNAKRCDILKKLSDDDGERNLEN